MRGAARLLQGAARSASSSCTTSSTCRTGRCGSSAAAATTGTTGCARSPGRSAPGLPAGALRHRPAAGPAWTRPTSCCGTSPAAERKELDFHVDRGRRRRRGAGPRRPGARPEPLQHLTAAGDRPDRLRQRGRCGIIWPGRPAIGGLGGGVREMVSERALPPRLPPARRASARSSRAEPGCRASRVSGPLRRAASWCITSGSTVSRGATWTTSDRRAATCSVSCRSA